MDVAMNGMVSLLPKLGELLKEEYKLQKSATQDVVYLQTELQRMHASLNKVASVPRDKLDEEDRLWAGEVREVSHDIEDLVENFLVSAQGAMLPPDAGCFKVLTARLAILFKMARARREVATAMEDIKGKVQEVASRDDRYRRRGGDGLNVSAAGATWRPDTSTTIDPLLSILYEKHTLIGIDDARDEIINKLRQADHVSKQLPKILSIVGFGGLGKTTLAKAVYDKLHKGFDCTAFVPVSRNPDVKKVFKKLLYELDNQMYNSLNLSDLDESQLIQQLRRSLGTKRYFIVIDDIWDTDAWKIIKLAFVDTNYESRIITTTRNVDVANTCCASDDLIHKMRPLSEGDSQRLFYMRIFANECCPSHLEKVSGDILKKCGGVPLAIITLASHLASNQQIKPIDQWHVLLESIGHGLANDGSIKNMKIILLLSYYDLPPLLKTCFLYLSIFPEDYRIGRDRLIRRWIAEGFFEGQKHQLGLIELGECCFSELVNRSLIQPISIDVDGRAKACIVHDMMLDVICDLSSEENFITVLDFMKEDISVKRKPQRISIQKCTDELSSTRLATMSLSQVRSFNLFSSLGANQGLPLSRFRVLRVLDLEDCVLSGHHSNKLRCVGNLLHLRYLGLKDTKLYEIPMEIGKLHFLQILDLRGINGSLPASVVRMRNLICLYLGPDMSLPTRFGNLTSLQELDIYDFARGVELEDLRYLTQLRLLSLLWPKLFAHDKLVTFVESLGKLAKLETLEIYWTFLTDVELDVMQDWVPSPYLRKLRLDGWFQTLPTWVNSSSLPLVSSLSINVRELKLEDINVLGTLPALRYIKLESTVGHGILSTEAFPCLRECDFGYVILEPRVFTRGAMPMVKKLKVRLRVSDILSGDLDLSIWNLPSLENVIICIYGAESERFDKAEDVIMRMAKDHPNCSVTVVDWYY